MRRCTALFDAAYDLQNVLVGDIGDGRLPQTATNSLRISRSTSPPWRSPASFSLAEILKNGRK